MSKHPGFSKRLQIAIARSGLKKGEIARAVGLPPTSLSRYLTGDRVPYKSVLHLLAQTLSVTVEDLLGSSSSAASAELGTVSRATKGLASDAQEAYIPDAVALTGLDAEDRRMVLLLLQALRSGDAQIRRYIIEDMKMLALAMEARRHKSREEIKDVL